MTCAACGYKGERFVPVVEFLPAGPTVTRYYCVGCFAELVLDELDDDEDTAAEPD